MDFPYWKGPFPGVDVQRRLPSTCGNVPSASRTACRGRPKSVRLQPGVHVRFAPGILFGISPESCPASPRNAVRLAPEYAGNVVDRFLQHHQRQNGVCRGDAGILSRFLAWLGQTGVVEQQREPATKGPRQNVTHQFQHYLLQERRLSKATLQNYVPFIDQFLSERFRNKRLNLSTLRATDVTGFVQREAHRLSPGRAKLLVKAVRSFFRYLRHRGEIPLDLAGCVPTVPNWSRSTLPKFLPPGTVQRVLKRCDRQAPLGRRNYAILLLLARLGLRGGEVVALNLEDIDWETSQMTVHGKGGRSTPMPLPADVGEAVAAYLRNGRPRSSSRRVFIRAKAPLGGFASSVAISLIVMRALERAGVESARQGADLFRHTLACDLLRQG